MKHGVLSVFVILIMFSGCASTTIYDTYPIAANDSDNMATLDIVRPNHPWGSLIRTPVYINNQLIGRLGPGGHIQMKIPAERTSVSVTTSDIVIDAKKGAAYYFRVTIPLQLWFMTPSFNIEQINK